MSQTLSQQLSPILKDLYNDFKPNVTFVDLSANYATANARQNLIAQTKTKLKSYLNQDVTIFGIETRGYFLAMMLAENIQADFRQIRKQGKLPGKVIQQKYTLEYGEDCLEVSAKPISGRAILIDDILATGGTLKAGVELLRQLGITDIVVLIIANINLVTTEQLQQELQIPILVLEEINI